jgi:hypothetical protein
MHWIGDCCTGLHAGFLGARSVMPLIVVNPETVEAMAALWAVQFSKEVGFYEVVFEGDAA